VHQRPVARRGRPRAVAGWPLYPAAASQESPRSAGQMISRGAVCQTDPAGGSAAQPDNTPAARPVADAD